MNAKKRLLRNGQFEFIRSTINHPSTNNPHLVFHSSLLSEDRFEGVVESRVDIINDEIVVQEDFDVGIGLARSIPSAEEQRFDDVETTFQRHGISIEIELK